MHNPVPVLDPLYIDYLTQIEIWDRHVFETKEFVNLNSTHQKFLRDILDGMLSRYEKGQPIGIWDINNIVVRDNVAASLQFQKLKDHRLSILCIVLQPGYEGSRD